MTKHLETIGKITFFLIRFQQENQGFYAVILPMHPAVYQSNLSLLY